MFKHLLVPTDGSPLSARGVRASVKLAKKLGAKVTGLYVALPYVPPLYGEAAMYYVPGLAPADFEKIVAKQSAKALEVLVRESKAAGVRCATVTRTAAQPWDAILKTARAARCDGIVMASHGRSAIGGAILGSETTQVLARSKVPVVVVR